MEKLSTTTLINLTKALLLSAAFILITNLSSAQVCASSGTVIYSLSNAGGIYPITVSNASVGTIVNSTSYGSSTSANSIGYNTVNGLFYYFQVALSGSKQFVSYNPVTNVYTTLASSSIAATVNRGCVSFDGKGYYCLDVNGNLYYYNIPSNTWALICSAFKDQFNNNVTSTFSSESSGDMAIDGLGNLWIVASNSSKWGLYELMAPLPTTSTASITVQQLVAPSTSTPAGAGFVGIAFSPTGDIYMGTTTDLYVMQPSFTLSHISAFSVAGVCGDLASCNYPYSILPVLWESFSVTLKGNESAAVAWEVTQQQNDKGYYVERSKDGASWEELGFVASFGGYESTENYSFTDNSPYNGKNYYRIREADINGRSNYSEIKTVTVEKANNALSVWPNPAKDVIRIQTNNASNSIARIYNQSGSLMSEHRLQGGISTINVSTLSFGAYIISVRNANGENYNQKFIKE